MKNRVTNPFGFAELDVRLRSAGPSVLLIEGEREGELARLVLEQADVPVRHVSSQEEAEKVLTSFVPEVLLVGWGEDGFDGRAILAMLKFRHPALRGTPVVLMTDHKLDEFTCYNLSRFNIKWILEKPIVPTGLPRLMRRIVRQDAVQVTTSGWNSLPRQVEFGQTASCAYMNAVV
jgi:DNA-binding response OmpR family regulator